MANTTPHGWTLIALFIALTFAMAKPIGAWLFALYEGRTPKYLGFLAPVERAFYALAGIDPEKEQGWRRYALHMLMFSAVGLFLTYAILRLQGFCRSIRRALPVCPRRSRSTPRSASSPTPTGKAMRVNRRCRTSARWSG